MTTTKPQPSRLYAIHREGAIVALVNARTQAGAVSHYVAANIRATLPTQGELLALGAAPVPILDALVLYPTPEGE